MNGATNKVLIICIAGLLMAATAGSWTMAQRMASVETKLASLTETMAGIAERVTYLERNGWVRP